MRRNPHFPESRSPVAICNRCPLSTEIDVSGGAGAGVRGAARSENSLAGRQARRGGSATASDPMGVVLAVDNNSDNTVSLYKVSTSTGALAVASPAIAASGQIPQFVVFYTAASGR